MTATHLDAVDELLHRTRSAQGLPAQILDASVLERVGCIIRRGASPTLPTLGGERHYRGGAL